MISILCLIARPPAIHEGVVTKMTPSWNCFIVATARNTITHNFPRNSSNFLIENRRTHNECNSRFARTGILFYMHSGHEIITREKSIFLHAARRRARREFIATRRRRYEYTEPSCKLNRWYHSARSPVCLSLSVSRFIVPVAPYE